MSKSNKGNSRKLADKLRKKVLHEQGKRYGIVIGVNHYVDDHISDLKYAVNDAEEMYKIMTDETCGLFKEEDVVLLIHDERNRQVKRESIGMELSKIARKAEEKDTFWLYFAGHAIEAEGTYGWVLPGANVDYMGDHIYESSRLWEKLRSIACKKKVLLIDACFAGNQNKGSRDIDINPEAVLNKYSGEGSVTLMSSNSEQKSAEIDEYKHGLFTYFLMKGLTGECVKKTKEKVDFDDLASYVTTNVRTEAASRNIRQHPTQSVDIEGTISLTLNKEYVGENNLITALQELTGKHGERFTNDEIGLIKYILENNRHSIPLGDHIIDLAYESLDNTEKIEIVQQIIDRIDLSVETEARIRKQKRKHDKKSSPQKRAETEELDEQAEHIKRFQEAIKLIHIGGQTTRLQQMIKDPIIPLKDDKHRTLLIYSVMRNDEKLTYHLLGKGSDVNQRDVNHHSALNYAILNENVTLVREIAKFSDLLLVDEDKFYNPFSLAIAIRARKVLEVLMEEGQKRNLSFGHIMKNGHENRDKNLEHLIGEQKFSKLIENGKMKKYFAYSDYKVNLMIRSVVG